jgi:flagellar motor switch protein FliG
MARKHNEPFPDEITELDGVTKAAILLLAVGPDSAADVLKHMPPERVEEVTRSLAGLGRVPDKIQNAVVEEFYSISIATQYANEGSLSYAKMLLQNSLDATSAERLLS